MPKLRSRQPALPAPLAVLTELERWEYARRKQLADAKQLEAIAAAAYLDAFGEELRERYGLPTAFNLDLATGHVTGREDQ